MPGLKTTQAGLKDKTGAALTDKPGTMGLHCLLVPSTSTHQLCRTAEIWTTGRRRMLGTDGQWRVGQ
jgi:hypothetical protein